MRSSIFSGGSNNTTTGSSSKVSSPRKSYHLTPTTSQALTSKRYRSSSPYINNPKPRTPTTSSLLTNGKHKPSWNLDDLIASYQDSGALPPILSPTLPNEETAETPEDTGIHKSFSTSNLVKNEPKLSLDFDSDDDKPLNKLVVPDEEDKVPRLLSPTLPSIFDTPISTPKPSSSSTFTNKRTSSSTIKWINKMNDPNKPKFLLRIVFDNKTKFKRSMTRTVSPVKAASPKLNKAVASPMNKVSITPVKLNGLGISTDRRKEEDHELNVKFKCEDKKEEVRKSEEKRKKEEARYKRTEREINLEKSVKELESQLQSKQRELVDLQAKLQEKSQAAQQQVHSQPGIDEQRKRDQLKQLTQDVIMREQSQPIEERIRLRSPEQTHSFSKSQRDEIKDSLQSKKNHWLNLSKSTKSKADSCKNEFLSIIINIDSILLKIVSIDFDERSKIVSEVLPSERSWKLLDQEINGLITRIEKYSKLVKEKIIFEFLKILVCILFQARAIILKRINSILTNVIDSYIRKNDDRLNTKIIELQQLALSNNTLILEHFMNSHPSFINASIPLRFPSTWFNKSLSLEIPQRDYNLKNFDNNIKPTNQVYYLPFGVYTNMNEFTAFLFNIMNEFIDIYNKYNSSNSINYKLQCGLS